MLSSDSLQVVSNPFIQGGLHACSRGGDKAAASHNFTLVSAASANSWAAHPTTHRQTQQKRRGYAINERERHAPELRPVVFR